MKTSYNFLWLTLALFPLLIIVMLLPVQPHDYWWYLRLGKDVLETNTVPIVDTYSSIQNGQPIVYQSWLSAVIFWWVYQIGEIPLTIFLASILIGITYAFLWLMLKEAGIGVRLTTLFVLLVGLSGSNNWTIRPQLFAYPLFLASLCLLIKWQNKNDKYLWLLIPLGFAWANLHGSFILLIALIGMALVFGHGARKKLFVIAIITLLSTLINPYGITLWKSIIDTFTAPGIRDLSPEWLAPKNEGWQMNIYFAWLILLVPLATIARQRISNFYGILFLAFTWLALTGIRYVIWDLFIIAILSANLMPEIIERVQETKFPSLNYGLGILFLIMPLTLLTNIRDSWWQDAPPPLDLATPVSASEWLLTHPELPGEMWNDVVFGSYLIHALPSRPVSIDTRIQVIYTAEQAQDYLLIQSVQAGWEEKLRQNHFNLLFLAQTQTNLVQAVENSNEWCKEYKDEVAVIFSRCELTP